MLSQDDPYGAVLNNLTLDFTSIRAREVQLMEKQFLQNKCCDV